MPKKPIPQARSRIWKKIRRLDLPEESKQLLRELWKKAAALIEAIVNWLYSKRHLASAVLLGVAVAYLLSYFPVLGPLLANLAISLSVFVGLICQFKADMDRYFSEVVPA